MKIKDLLLYLSLPVILGHDSITPKYMACSEATELNPDGPNCSKAGKDFYCIKRTVLELKNTVLSQKAVHEDPHLIKGLTSYACYPEVRAEAVVALETRTYDPAIDIMVEYEFIPYKDKD